MKPAVKIFLAASLLFAMSCKKEENNTVDPPPPVCDTSHHDPDQYDAVTIGTQKWMSRNLEVMHYRNGDAIPQVESDAAWAALTTGAWCWYQNQSANGPVYGRLYNWYAVNDPRGLAPAGWHVPTIAEWDTLSTALGGEFEAGGKLKQSGYCAWFAPNVGATNSSGFTAVASGLRIADGTFIKMGIFAMWWSATPAAAGYADYFYVSTFYAFTYTGSDVNAFGLAVRCVRD